MNEEQTTSVSGNEGVDTSQYIEKPSREEVKKCLEIPKSQYPDEG